MDAGDSVLPDYSSEFIPENSVLGVLHVTPFSHSALDEHYFGKFAYGNLVEAVLLQNHIVSAVFLLSRTNSLSSLRIVHIYSPSPIVQSRHFGLLLLLCG